MSLHIYKLDEHLRELVQELKNINKNLEKIANNTEKQTINMMRNGFSQLVTPLKGEFLKHEDDSLNSKPITYEDINISSNPKTSGLNIKTQIIGPNENIVSEYNSNNIEIISKDFNSES